jgi:hypothetical protein
MFWHRETLVFTAGFGVMLAAGWIGFPHTLYKSEAQPIDFNHRIHKDKAAQKCTDCHSITADGTFAGIPSLTNCSGCHAEPMGTTANEKILVASYVKPGREIPWRSYARQPMNVRFSHAVHVNLGKLACEKCHGAHGDTMNIALYQEDRISGYSRNVESMTMSACEDCHRQRGVAAGCLGCHK